MKAHIARNQNAGVPLALGWNLSAGDRGKLDGMAPAFGMKVLPVSPADAGKAVVTPANRSWVFGDLLAHLQEEHTAFTAAKENQTR